MSRPHAVKARWPVCGRCRHPDPLHHHDGEPGPCLAQGCHGGPDNEPCPGFISQVEWVARKEAMKMEAERDQEQQERDPRMASEAMQERARELREVLEAELAAERRTMVIRVAAGAALVIAVAVLIRQVRRRAQD